MHGNMCVGNSPAADAAGEVDLDPEGSLAVAVRRLVGPGCCVVIMPLPPVVPCDAATAFH